MLDYCIQHLSLRFNRGGQLLPWIGPALRGALAVRLKEQVCRHPPHERTSKWVHCTGCPYIADCPYGELLEPDASDATVRTDHTGKPIRFSGAERAARPVVVSPLYPVSENVCPGLRLPVRITAVGRSAISRLEYLLLALREAGRVTVATGRHAEDEQQPSAPSISGGLGPDHVGFTVVADAEWPAEHGRLATADLPAVPDALPGTIPRLGIGLTSPLFLRPRDGAGRRRALRCPQFVDLFLAAARTISAMFALYDVPLPADFARLKAVAQSIRCIDHCYEPFEQRKWSSRNDQRFLLHGVVGGGVYANVPMAYLPWMYWGGRLHVGQHRVAGAGGWRLVLD